MEALLSNYTICSKIFSYLNQYGVMDIVCNIYVHCGNELKKNLRTIMKKTMTDSLWVYISRNKKLDEHFMADFIKELNLGYISRYQSLSEDFMIRFKYELDWLEIVTYQKISERTLVLCSDTIHDKSITNINNIPYEIIKKYSVKFNWNHISRYVNLSGEFVKEFEDCINWREFSERDLNIELIDKYKDKLHWDIIFKNNQLKTKDEVVAIFYSTGKFYILNDTYYDSDNDTIVLKYKRTKRYDYSLKTDDIKKIRLYP